MLLTGPGKVGQALAVDTSWSSHVLYRAGGLFIEEGDSPASILTGPRVGIDYALPRDRKRRWRFAIADTPWVSIRRGLDSG